MSRRDRLQATRRHEGVQACRGRGRKREKQSPRLWNPFFFLSAASNPKIKVPPLPEDITAFTAGERLRIISMLSVLWTCADRYARRWDRTRRTARRAHDLFGPW